MVERIMHRILGVCCLTFGVGGISLSLVGDRLGWTEMGGEWWILFFWGLGFFISGLWVLRVRLPWLDRRERVRDWDAFWPGVLGSLAGLMLIVISFADPRDEAFHAPRLVITMAGATFFFASLLPLLWSLGYDTALLTSVLAALIVTCFGLVAAGVVLGPGNLELSGRLLFSPGALLLLGFAARLWWNLGRKFLEWRRRKSR